MAVDGGDQTGEAEGEPGIGIEMYPLTPEEEANQMEREALESHIEMWKNTPLLPGKTSPHPTTLAAIRGLEADLLKIPKAPPPKVAPLQDEMAILKY